MGLQQYRDNILGVHEIRHQLLHDLLHEVARERQGESIDRPLMKNLLRMLTSVNLYRGSFEPRFLERTTEFYTSESTRKLDEVELPEYLRYVERRLAEESERVYMYLDSGTKKKLISVAEHELIQVHLDSMLKKGFAELMKLNRKDDLRLLYSLFARAEGLPLLKQAFNQNVKAVGKEIINDPEKDKQMVESLLEYKDQLDAILVESFRDDESFRNALKEACEFFVNTRANKPAERIAKFIDAKLRLSKGTTEDEMELLFDKVMVLFRFIHGKDIFEAFYKKDLAKRLLLGKSASIDAEKAMIGRLKSECGGGFTNKLEGMFKDMDLSKDILAAFSETTKKGPHTIDLNAHVLTSGYWPPYQPVTVKIPPNMAALLDTFKTFYLSKYNGRKLTFQHSLAFCMVRAGFPRGQKILTLSLFQTLALLPFNDKSTLTFAELEEATGLAPIELKRVLTSLSLGKFRPINKLTEGKEVVEADSFAFNAEFRAKPVKIKINTVQIKETTEEEQKTQDTVFQDRQYQIDAAIVRIMKTRKVLSHQNLLAELLPQLRFPAKPVDIKKRIESLIERDYLERDKTDNTKYHYLA